MMLEELLRILRSGETCSLPDLSRRLGVSEALLARMLSDLQRMGYLQPLDGCGPQACPHCSQSGTCSPAASPKLWKFIEPVTH